MIVFKTFLKVLNKCKVPIIMYTIILIFFAAFNVKNNEQTANFSAEKPSILIVNNDEDIGITHDFIQYIKQNATEVDLGNDEKDINDALFYRQVSYIVYIPKNFRSDFLDGKNPELEIKTTGEYQSALSGMIVERYLKTAQIQRESSENEEELIKNTNDVLSKIADIEVKSKLDTASMQKLTSYFNFSSYSILAVGIYVVCMILLIFREENVRKRTMISSIDYKKYNRILLLSNSLFCLILWAIYIILPIFLIGNSMFSINGLWFAINSLVFTLSALTLSFFIGNLIKSKNSVNGIVNVVALGSSFLCGAFVPMKWIPDFVQKIAHILPAFWFISGNEIIGATENFSGDIIKKLIVNMLVIIGFSVIFVIGANIVSKKKTE